MKEEITIVIPLGKECDVEYEDGIREQNIKIIKEIGPHPSKNRNKGAEKARTKYIGFINGHTELDKSWKEEVNNFFKKYPETDIVGGPQLTPKGQRGFAKISGYALTSKFGAAGTSDRYKKGKLNLDADESSITSANLVCKKEVFKKIKFDETLYPGEDPKFIEDAKKEGFKIAYSPEIITYNKRRATMGDLIRQIFNYGKVRPAKEPFRQTMKKPMFLVPSLFVIYLLVSSVFLMLNFYSYFFIIPLMIYAVIDIFSSLFESIKNKNFPAFFVLPFIYPIIHISYGIGMIWGYLKKI
jgi:succinoglycan biosynthesis protein ExoA